MRQVSRRAVLGGAGLVALGAAGAAAVEQGALPGRSWTYRHLGLDGPDGTVPDVAPGPTLSGRFASRARQGRECGWTIAWPPGARRALPVAVFLHGQGDDHASAFDRTYLGLDRFLAQAVQAGAAPFALAGVDGGDTYWHARADGEDSGTMVVEEFLPLLTEHGLDVRRVGFLGLSMGGYGALRLAGVLGAGRVAAVTAVSPALWHDFAQTAPGAFDDRADFARSTVLGRQAQLDGIPVRIDCGEGDPFYAATKDYVGGFSSAPSGGFERGDHDIGYWRRIMPFELRFLARAFAAGGRTAS